MPDVAELPPVTGLLVANEWLDDVPLDVVELTPDGPRLVLVDADGASRLGPAPGPADRDWLARWWPLAATGDRAEVGRSRDDGLGRRGRPARARGRASRSTTGTRRRAGRPPGR